MDKARISNNLSVLHTIKKAQELYYLANGLYAVDLSQLDLDYSQLCPILTGANKNMLFGCSDGYFDNLTGQGNVVSIDFWYCPTEAKTANLENRATCQANTVAQFQLHYDHITGNNAGKMKCTSSTQRGKRLCEMVN